MNDYTCWECGKLVAGAVCPDEHPGYDHARAQRNMYVAWVKDRMIRYSGPVTSREGWKR